jgi:hypothetical protein
MTATYTESPVLAIYATSRGFGYVLFEGPESPYDWGVREIREKHRIAKTLDALKNLIDRYRPEAIVIEDTNDRKLRPSSRIRKLYRTLVHLASTEYVEVYRFPNEAVKRYFRSVGASTKFEIAKAIARQIPAFGHRLPSYRKAWMNVDPRQSLFDAAALGLVFYASRGIPSPYYPEESA